MSGWRDSSSTARKALLLVGDEGSGKTAWASAVANKCAAVRVHIGKRLFHRGGWKRFFSPILQLIREDKYVVVLVDRLEIFLERDCERRSNTKVWLFDISTAVFFRRWQGRFFRH